MSLVGAGVWRRGRGAGGEGGVQREEREGI